MTVDLRPGYRRCAELTRMHGTTYYWGALLLPKRQRRDVYTVYALCRLADDIVDEPEKVDVAVPKEGPPQQRLAAFKQQFFAALDGEPTNEPVMAAIVDSIRRRGTDPECFERFFKAMESDLVKDTWQTWEELRDGYMEGSAAVIGEMMLPVLEPFTSEAKTPARALGLAFQLTNFLRDVGEDLDRGRVYLPQEDLERFGANPWLREPNAAWQAMMAQQIARNRELYAQAEPGLDMLPSASRRCVGTALVLYSRILDRIEAADYNVFAGRIRVPRTEKLGVTVRAFTLGLPKTNFATR